MIFLEASSLSLIQNYICQENSQNLLEVLTKGELEANRGILENWTQLESLLDASDLFGESANTYNLIDLQIELSELVFSKNLENLFKTNFSQNNLFWSSNLRSLPAANQKIWTDLAGKYIKLSYEASLAKNLASSYLNQKSFNLSYSQLDKLLSNCIDYQEVIDKIDVLDFSEDKDTLLDWFTPEKQPELFKLDLRANNLLEDGKKWLKYVTPDEIQLALALLWSKSIRIGKKEIQELIIKADLEMKTRTKLNQTLLFKKLIFDIASLNYNPANNLN